MDAADPTQDPKEELLREDRRLLGRLLGEVIREHAGEDMLEKIERIRQTAVAFRRAGAPREPGVRAGARARGRRFGPGARRLVRARISPVLTAHPTEVQRQSILDSEREIARLIAQRDGDGTEREEALHREVLRLWLTSMLRLTKLEVADEIGNGLAYFRTTFLEQLPWLYERLEAALGAREPLAPFLTVGTWIGGDRDGNPNVTAGVLELALAQQARVALEHYLEQVNLLGKELAVSTRIQAAPPQIVELAEASGDDSPYRRDEPYRRALTGIYARLAASAERLAGFRPSVAPAVARPAYERAEDLAADLDAIAQSLEAQGAGGGSRAGACAACGAS